MIDVMKEAFLGSMKSVYSMAIIIIPLMVVLQIAKDYKLLNKIAESLRFVTKPLGISKTAIFPLVVGVFFGISYGAGVIIDSSKEGNITKKDGVLLMVFFSACHGMIEDTLIFAVLGANAYLIISIRVISAIGLTYLLSQKVKVKSLDPVQGRMEEV